MFPYNILQDKNENKDTTKATRITLKEKKTQSKCMFRLGDDDIESPYKKFLDTFDFFV